MGAKKAVMNEQKTGVDALLAKQEKKIKEISDFTQDVDRDNSPLPPEASGQRLVKKEMREVPAQTGNFPP